MPLTTIDLWPKGSPHNPCDSAPGPRLDIYTPVLPAASPRAAVIVCPGGGYRRLDMEEGEPVANYFALHGIVGMVLHYRIWPHRFPASYVDACRAMRLVREQSATLNIDPHRLGLMGFSSGGHLAATVGTQPDLFRDTLDDLGQRWSARPDRLLLAYAAISFSDPCHEGSVTHLLGPETTVQQRMQLSNELHVTASNPPTFLFHTADDDVVPVENSLSYAAACVRAGVPVELHIYREGPHGRVFALEDPRLRSWDNLMIDWLRDWVSA